MDLVLPDLFERGGWVMFIIFFCSVIALGFFIERMFKLRRARVLPGGLIQSVTDMVARRKFADAIYLCQGETSPLARIYAAAIKANGQPRAVIKEAVEEVGRREAASLNRYLSVLSTTVSLAPLLGLLGTVSGMIRTFNVISYAGIGNPATLAGGISEALLNTAAGLAVAIPALVGYKYLSGKADGLVSELEDNALQLVEALKGGEQ